MPALETALDVLNGIVDRLFTAFARLVSRFGAVVFFVGVVIAVVFSVGLIRSKTEKDANALWVHLDSRLVDEKKDFERYFGGLTRKVIAMTSTADGSALFSKQTSMQSELTPRQVMDGHTEAMRVWERETVLFEGRNYTVHDFCERPLVPSVFKHQGLMPVAYQALTECLAKDTDFNTVYAGLVASERYNDLPQTFSPLPKGWGIDEFPCSRASVMDCFQEGREVDYNEPLKQLDRVAGGVLIASQTTFGDLSKQLGARPLPVALNGPENKLRNLMDMACWMVTKDPSSTECLIEENSTSRLNDTSVAARGQHIAEMVTFLQERLPLNNTYIQSAVQGVITASDTDSESQLERAVRQLQRAVLLTLSGNVNPAMSSPQTKVLAYYFSLQSRLVNDVSLSQQNVLTSCLHKTLAGVFAQSNNIPVQIIEALVSKTQPAINAQQKALLARYGALFSQLNTVVSFFGSIGYWWRKSYKTMTGSDILSHFTLSGKSAADPARIGDPTAGLAQCIRGQTRCCVAWNGATIGNDILMGGGDRGPVGVIKTEGEGDVYYPVYNSLLSIRSGLEDYNQDNPLWPDILTMRYPSTESLWTDAKRRKDLAEAFDKQLTDSWKKLYKREPGSKYEDSAEYSKLKLDISTGNALRDLISDASKVPTNLLATSYVVMIVYVLLALGNFAQVGAALVTGDKTRAAEAMVNSHSALGLIGIVIVALSSVAGIGFASYCGVLLNGISINLAPFISLGLGIDDMFVLVHTMSTMYRSDLSPGDNLAATLRFAGPSVLLTSVANSIAFFLVVIVPVAGIRQLVLLLAVLVIMNLVLLFLLFVPCMMVDLKRVKGRCMDLFFIKVEADEKKSKDLDEEEKHSIVDHFVEKYYGPFLSNTIVKIVVIVFFVVAFAVLMWSGIDKTEEGLRTSDIALRDTYQQDAANILESIIPVQKTSLVTVSERLPFSDTEAQSLLLDTYKAVDGSPWLVPGMQVTSLAWFANGSSSMTTQYANGGPELLGLTGGPSDCPQLQNGTIRSDCYKAFYPRWQENIGAAFTPYLYCLDGISGPRVPCNESTATVKVARTSAYVRNLTTHQRHLDCIRDLRSRIDRQSNGNVRSYAIGYIFYFWEQYFDIETTLVKVIGFGLLGVFAVTFLFQLNPWLSVIICAVVFMIDMELYGLSRPMGVKLNGVSVANFCVSIGLAVEFTAHVARAFLLASGTKDERMVKALREMVMPMINGAMSTIFAVVVLVGAKFPFFRTYYALMFVVVVLIACVNGLVFLPVVLSIIGPPQQKQQTSTDSEESSKSPSANDLAALNHTDSSLPLKSIKTGCSV